MKIFQNKFQVSPFSITSMRILRVLWSVIHKTESYFSERFYSENTQKQLIMHRITLIITILCTTGLCWVVYSRKCMEKKYVATNYHWIITKKQKSGEVISFLLCLRFPKQINAGYGLEIPFNIYVWKIIFVFPSEQISIIFNTKDNIPFNLINL